MWDKFMALIGGLIPDDKKAEFETIKRGLKLPETTPDPQPKTVTGDQQVFQELQKQLAALTAENANLMKILGEERTQREQAQKSIQEQQKAENAKKITDYLAEMKKDGRLPAKSEELEKSWQSQFEANFEAAKQIADALPKTATGKTQTDQKTTTTGDKDNINPAPLMELPAHFSKYINGVSH